MNTLSLFDRNPRPVGNGHAHFDASSPLAAFHREMDPLLDGTFGSFGFTRSRSSLPTVEVQEAEKEYLVNVDLTGFERVIGIDTDIDESQIRAHLRNGVLAVTLPKKPERQ